MKRPWLVWLSFGLCAAVLLAAMGWISRAALRADAAEAAAIANADLEEDVRLALWRMDALLGNVLAQEAARLYFAFPSPEPGGALQTTLPKSLPRYVLLHFQCAPDGQVTSPWVVKNAAKAKSSAVELPLELIKTADERLCDLRTRIGYSALAERLPRTQAGSSDSLLLARENPQNEPLAANGNDAQNGFNSRDGLNQVSSQNRGRRFDYQQSQLSNTEFTARQDVQRLLDSNLKSGTLSILGDVSVGEITPLWLGDDLFLARWVRRGTAGQPKEYFQGAWLDWRALHADLLNVVADKFPGASLQPIDPAARDEADTRERYLAALPLAFLPGDLPEVAAPPAWTPMRVSLAVAWGCVFLAALAVAGLLLGVLRLSERRAAFVSAVTHELRTPLTTFRMYADMLARGMVPQPERQQHYLNTLRVESDRLTHLVANVLSYARLERGRPVRQLRTVALGELVSQTQARLNDRAEQGGLRLQVALDPSAAGTAVRCDPSVVEQILFNLVDNACKYAAEGLPPVVELTAGSCGGNARGVVLSVRDHGPGIAASDRRRVFRTFGKSAHQAANSAPGVGLGLGLSRRLARAMGGDLRLEAKTSPGAAFALTLRGAS